MFNPFDDWSKELWGNVEGLNDFLNRTLTDPAAAFSSNDWGKTIFSVLWPIGWYISFCVLIVLLGGLSMMITRGVAFLPRAIFAAVLTGPSAVVFWNLNQGMLDVNQKTSASVATMGPDSISSTQVPFPYVGEGFGPWLLYLIDLVFLGALCVLVVAIIVGMIIMAGGVVVSVAMWALGDIGEQITRWGVAAWIACFAVAMPLVAFFRRVGQMAANGINEKPFAQVLAYTMVILTFVAIVMLFVVARKTVNKLGGGRSNSTVDGHTDSTVKNDPDVNVSNNPSVTTIQSTTTTTPGETSAGTDSSPSTVTKLTNAASAGAVVIGHPEAVPVIQEIGQKIEGQQGPIQQREVPATEHNQSLRARRGDGTT